MSRVDPTAPAGADSAATTDGPAPDGPSARAHRRLPGLSGLLRNELQTTFRRWRTLALLGVLVAVPVLVGIAVRIQTGDGSGGGDGDGGPAFLGQVAQNGLFLVFASLAATLPFFLPMTVGVVAGDAIAGEAAGGTLRYLLVAPAGRNRLLAVKYATTMVFCCAATLVVALSALVTGLLLFPVGSLTLLSGTSVSFGDGLLRALFVALAVAASLAGLAAIGLFVSTLTDSGVGAMAATVGLLVLVQIVDTIPQLHVVHPYLFPHYWLSFADLLRDPVYWDPLLKNFGLQALYVAVFGSAAWARFATKDVTA
jgi:ABC-2 type transport system permease protein